MIKLSQPHNEIIRILFKKGALQSSAIHEVLSKNGSSMSFVTTKRALSAMAKEGLIFSLGAGRSVRYDLAVPGRVFFDVDAKEYCGVEPDKRYGASAYNFDLFPHFPPEIFDAAELKSLEDATADYRNRIQGVSPALQKKELERLVIELSWKSSKIEGNTYTLLDTEKLIKDKKEAKGHSKEEAQMIVNHKDAFYFVRENAPLFRTLTGKNLERLHAVLVNGMGIGTGFRKGLAGVTGSKYRPLDNRYQIREAVDALAGAVGRVETPYSKALVALLGVSYIQPFEDGNKRTSRLMANAILLAHRCAPLSYRSVEESEYREATLAFYELNSIIPFKKIFIGQYEFAAKNYAAV